jgi:hypothetical protein
LLLLLLNSLFNSCSHFGNLLFGAVLHIDVCPIHLHELVAEISWRLELQWHRGLSRLLWWLGLMVQQVHETLRYQSRLAIFTRMTLDLRMVEVMEAVPFKGTEYAIVVVVHDSEHVVLEI